MVLLQRFLLMVWWSGFVALTLLLTPAFIESPLPFAIGFALSWVFTACLGYRFSSWLLSR